MNSEISKTSKPHVLIPNLTDKIDLRRDMEQHNKNHTATISLKYQLQHRIINLNYLMDHILYQIFNTFLSIF